MKKKVSGARDLEQKNAEDAYNKTWSPLIRTIPAGPRDDLGKKRWKVHANPRMRESMINVAFAWSRTAVVPESMHGSVYLGVGRMVLLLAASLVWMTEACIWTASHT